MIHRSEVLMAAVRIALLNIRLVMRTKVALFFTFLFPVIFLFVYAGIFAHGNPDAVAYLFGPVVTLNIMGSGFWGLGLQSVMQRERGSLRRYRLAPIGAGTVVSSNLLANYLLELPTIALLIFCAMVFFHMPLKIDVLTLLALVTVGTIAFAGFGLTIASVANTMQEAQVYNNLAWFSLLFLSGVTIPLPLLPHWIQRLAAFLPATYLVGAFQAIMSLSQPLSVHWPEMLALIVSGVFGLLFAWRLFRWEKEERIPTRRKLWSLVFLIPFLLMGLWMNIHTNPTTSWAMSYSRIGRGPAVSGEATNSENTQSENLIEGFENLQANERLFKRWQVWTDAALGGQSVAELSLVSPGAAGTQHAMRLQGRLAPKLHDQGYVTANCDLGRPPGARGVRGIEFWVRGDPRVYQIHLSLPELASGFNPGINFIPSRDWQSVRIPAARVATPAVDSSDVRPWNLQIVIAGSDGEFSFEIDQIKFY